MKIRVLGCHGSEQLFSEPDRGHQCRTCGFLINDEVMLDAGTIGAALTLEEQQRIRHVLISHLHFDHIQGLPTFADNRADAAARPAELLGIRDVLDGLHAHIFNDAVYPNFFKLPASDRPVFVERELHAGQAADVGGLRVVAVPVNHLVPSVGFLIRDGGGSILYSGDTYTTEEIWRQAAQDESLQAAFIEVSFSDEMADLAYASRHLTPSMFGQEFAKIRRPDLPVYAYHMKPRERPVIERQLRRLGIRHLHLLEEGQEITIS
ncbi:MBL fold metallo-hydrolase [Candidatus Nitrospira bockiana]